LPLPDVVTTSILDNIIVPVGDQAELQAASWATGPPLHEVRDRVRLYAIFLPARREAIVLAEWREVQRRVGGALRAKGFDADIAGEAGARAFHSRAGRHDIAVSRVLIWHNSV